MMRRVLVLFVAAATTGCFTYVPAEIEGPSRGETIRAHLSPPLTVPVGDIAVQQTESVAGEVVRWSDQYLVLSAQTLISSSGQDFLGRGFTVQLPRSSLVQLEARRFSTWRTALLTGGIIAGSVILGILAQEGFGGGDADGGGGQPQ